MEYAIFSQSGHPIKYPGIFEVETIKVMYARRGAEDFYNQHTTLCNTYQFHDEDGLLKRVSNVEEYIQFSFSEGILWADALKRFLNDDGDVCTKILTQKITIRTIEDITELVSELGTIRMGKDFIELLDVDDGSGE